MYVCVCVYIYIYICVYVYIYQCHGDAALYAAIFHVKIQDRECMILNYGTNLNSALRF